MQNLNLIKIDADKGIPESNDIIIANNRFLKDLGIEDSSKITPDELVSKGYAIIHYTTPPEVSPLQEVVQGAPESINLSISNWKQTWNIVDKDLSAEERAAIEAEMLSAEKSIKKQEVEQNRDGLEKAGVSFNFSDGTGTISTFSDKDIRNLMSLAVTALLLKDTGNTSQNLKLRDVENTVHTCSIDEIISAALLVQNYVNSTYEAAWAKKAEVEACTTIDEVKALDLTLSV